MILPKYQVNDGSLWGVKGALVIAPSTAVEGAVNSTKDIVTVGLTVHLQEKPGHFPVKGALLLRINVT